MLRLCRRGSNQARSSAHCHPNPVAFCGIWGGSTSAPRPALPDPLCSIAAAPVHICPCARSYLLQLKPALQHCQSSLEFIINFLFPTPPAPLSSTKCPEALQLFQHFFPSWCVPSRVGQSCSGGWAGSSELPGVPRPAWLSRGEAKSIKAHPVSKQCGKHRSRAGS